MHSRGCSSVALAAAAGGVPKVVGSTEDGFDSMMTELLRGWAVAGLLWSESAQV